MGYVEAVKELAASVGMQVPAGPPRTPEEAKRQARETDLAGHMQKAMEYYRAQLKQSPRAIEYLKRRGVTGETAARFGVGYAPDDWQALKSAFADYGDAALVECGLVIEAEGRRYDRFRDRVMFPIFNRRDAVVGFGGRVIGEGEPKYLNSPETPLFQKGQEIYGLGHAREAIREARRALVVEGYLDVLALAQHGLRYAVATLGTATTPVHVTRLLRELREHGAELVFCFDGDAAGRKAAWRALEVCLPLATDTNPVRFLLLPEGEDPDTLIRAHGRREFERRIAEAQTLSSYLLGELRAQSDLASAEGRSSFLVAARELVQRLAAPMLRLQLLRAIAPLAQLAPEDVERLFSSQEGPRYRGSAPARAIVPREPTSAEQGLLRCVLTDPGLARELDVALLDDAAPEAALLRLLAQGAADLPSGAMLVEQFRGGPNEQHVARAQAAALESHLDAEAAGHEFRQLQIALRIRGKHREIEALKARVGSDPALNAELNSRIKELHELKGQRS